MNFLDPIHINNIGAAYAILNSEDGTDDFQKVQLQIGDIAILMEISEMSSFLEVVRSARKECKCAKCTKDKGYKIIKCDSVFAEIKLKATPSMIDGLEELILSVIFNQQINSILEINEIN